MPIAQEVDVAELARLTEGYSGAEIDQICREAGMKAWEENFNFVAVTRDHFMAVLKTLTPRTPASLINIYEKYVNKSL